MLAYLTLGLFFFFMMRAIGEMFYADPTQHTFVSFISRYLGPTIGHFRTCLDTLTFDLILVKLDQKQEFLIHEKLCTPL